jgi:anti-sigma B factor antagonist
VTTANLPDGTSADDAFDLLTVSTRTCADGAVVVSAAGEVDAFTTPDLRSELEAGLRSRPPGLVIDLSGVRFLSSAGLTLLVDVRTSAHAAGVPIVLVARTRAVTGALAVTGLSDLFTVTRERRT